MRKDISFCDKLKALINYAVGLHRPTAFCSQMREPQKSSRTPIRLTAYPKEAEVPTNQTYSSQSCSSRMKSCLICCRSLKEAAPHASSWAPLTKRARYFTSRSLVSSCCSLRLPTSTSPIFEISDLPRHILSWDSLHVIIQAPPSL